MSDLRATREELAEVIHGTYLPARLWAHISDESRQKYLEAADAILARFSLPEQEWEYGATRDPGSAYAEYVTGDEGTVRGYVKGRPHL